LFSTALFTSRRNLLGRQAPLDESLNRTIADSLLQESGCSHAVWRIDSTQCGGELCRGAKTYFFG
jgi:hypothetical protein